MACGEGSDESAAVEASATEFLAALANADGTAACSLTTERGQAKLRRVTGAPASVSCARIIEVASTRLSPATKAGLRTARVEALSIDGSRAAIEDSDITSERGDLSEFLDPSGPPTIFTKQADGSWKLDS